MPYGLKRLKPQPAVGDSGPMSMFIIYDECSDKLNYEQNAKPRVGGVIRVGSPYAHAVQGYWQTSRITEILEDQENYVRFKTLNSEYEWSSF